MSVGPLWLAGAPLLSDTWALAWLRMLHGAGLHGESIMRSEMVAGSGRGLRGLGSAIRRAQAIANHLPGRSRQPSRMT